MQNKSKNRQEGFCKPGGSCAGNTQPASDKGLTCRLYRKLKKLNASSPARKWAGNKNRIFLKHKFQIANRHMKKCSGLLIMRELQIKNIVGYHLTPVKIAVIQKSKKQMLVRL